ARRYLQRASGGGRYFRLLFPLQYCWHWAAGQRRTLAQFWKHALLVCACTRLEPIHCSVAVPPSVNAPAKRSMPRSVFMGLSV
ncbi:MAG TPA: hypothetical protein VG758_26920, partial [Hyphomicrobiaceae bacterium]|nr:hypothetical protein [Hyphomicrobiaceae bacterium]